MADNSLIIAFVGEAAEILDCGRHTKLKDQFKALRAGENPQRYDRIAVWKKRGGETNSHDFAKALRKTVMLDAPAPEPEAPTAPAGKPEQSGEADAPDIEALKALAAGDGRKAEVKEAKEKLAELGIIV